MSRLDKLSQLENEGKSCMYDIGSMYKLTYSRDALYKICEDSTCKSCPIPKTIHVKSKLTQ